MANNPSSDGPTDDFFEQILGFPAYAPTDANLAGNSTGSPMMLQLSSGDGAAHMGGGGGGGGFHGSVFPLGLSLEQGSKQGFREDVGDGRSSSSSMKNTFSGHQMSNTASAMPHPPSIRPRVRARRGQATDPHSIAERLRRERIAERMRALQDLVPSVNKTDRAAMLDEIVEYVKFLRLQVKVLSMSRLGGAGAVAPLVTDIPISSLEQEASESGRHETAWEKWSNDGTEKQVAKLMEENVGAAMHFLQSKALCIMPISLASAIYHTQPPDATTVIKSESHPPS